MTVVTLESLAPKMSIAGTLLGKVTGPVPRPRFDVQDRPLDQPADVYTGHDAYELRFTIKLDNPGNRSVEGKIGRLHDLAERRHWAGRFEPPVLKVTCKAIRNTGWRWRLAEIVEQTDRALYQPDGDQYVYIADLRLIRHTVDPVLSERLKSRLPADGSRGLVRRTTTVREGEISVYDVARRVYHNPAFAAEIARANPQVIQWLGQRLKKGTKLRLPA